MIKILTAIIFCTTLCSSQGQSTFFALYNTENLFDTINNPYTKDDVLTPEKYNQKISNITRVISEVPFDIMGLVEIESQIPLEDIIANPIMAKFVPEYIYYPSRDARGISVAAIFNSITVKPIKAIPLYYRNVSRGGSRHILYIHAEIHSKPYHILICHLPSVTSNSIYRKTAAESVAYYVDSLSKQDGEVILMGDLNANPGSKIMNILTKNLYNPFSELFDKGYGSYRYNKRWNMYDAILTQNQNCKAGIFVKDYLMETEGYFKGHPIKGEFSDHLPVWLEIYK